MKSIMIIDDSKTIRLSLELSIKNLGYPIVQAENGRDAFLKLKDIKNNGDDVALLIVDVNMPAMDGITFVKKFRESDKFTPIIILTSESEDNKVKEGKEAGASGWIVKPFQPDESIVVTRREPPALGNDLIGTFHLGTAQCPLKVGHALVVASFWMVRQQIRPRPQMPLQI